MYIPISFSFKLKKNIKLVGGAVRVALNNKKTKDLDFAVNMRPDLVKQKLEKKILNLRISQKDMEL